MMNRSAYTEIWFINNFMLSPARDGSVTVFVCINMQEKGALEFKVSKVGVCLRETHSLLTLNYPFGASFLEVYEYADSGQTEWLRLQCNLVTAGISETVTKL